MLYCKSARVGTRLLTYEDDVTGDPIDMFSPVVALEPLAAIVPHLLPCAAANGLTEFVEGQELWLVVDGCATDADAMRHIGSELVFSRFDAVARQKENAALRAMIEAIGLMCAQSAPSAAASALEVACKGRRKLDVAKCLVGLMPSTNADGKGPLHNAAAGGHSSAARFLVQELGANVNDKDSEGCTPLHAAAQNGHADAARVLVKELDADVNSKTTKGATPLHSGAENGHADVVRVLVKELNADVNSKISNGSTPLHFGAQSGHTDVARVLVKELGADVNSKNSNGWAPLHAVAYNGHADVARVLVNELGADVNCKNNNGSTPLHFGAQITAKIIMALHPSTLAHRVATPTLLVSW